MKIGQGIFMWDVNERRTQRYGAFFLTGSTYSDTARADIQIQDVSTFIGKQVRAYCIVTEARDSSHVGDHAIQVFPSKPNVGDRIDLGVGTLFQGKANDGSRSFGLRPDDERTTFQMDPRPWYQLHDQTVELYIEETDEPFSEVPPFKAVTSEMAIDNGDGSFQIVGGSFSANETISIEPVLERLGDGLFLLKNDSGKSGTKRNIRRMN